VINNAGTAKMGGLLTTDVREHQMIHTLNTTALLRLSYAALAAFSPRGQGTLINIASILALHALPGSAVYSASKAWVLSFTRALQESLPTAVCVFRRYSRRQPRRTCGRPPASHLTRCPLAR
jgi:short-subunit dehydrogenase